MNLTDEYKQARDYVENELDFGSINSEVSVFEFNIRFVGGLLTGYALTKDPIYLKKAEEIAEKLLPAFNTPTGIPYSIINPSTGKGFWSQIFRMCELSGFNGFGRIIGINGIQWNRMQIGFWIAED